MIRPLIDLIQRKWLNFKIDLRIQSYKYRYKNVVVKSILSNESFIKDGLYLDENINIGPYLEDIGYYVYIGKNTQIYNCKRIGSFSSISSDVKIGLMSHPIQFISTSPAFYQKRRKFIDKNIYDESKGDTVEIGPDVLISANALILNGVKIGVGAIVGAGAFVNKDVPPYSIVAGVPAKVLGYRFNEVLIEKLIQSKWWEADLEKIKQAKNFDCPEKFLRSLQN